MIIMFVLSVIISLMKRCDDKDEDDHGFESIMNDDDDGWIIHDMMQMTKSK